MASWLANSLKSLENVLEQVRWLPSERGGNGVCS
jgi:hypothetical protein